MSLRLLSNPTDSEIDQIVDVCIRAYEGDVVIRSMTGNKPELEGSLFRAMLTAGRLEGAIYVIEAEDSKAIVSMGLWFGPGTSLFKSEEQRALGWNTFWGSLSPEDLDWWAYLNNATDGMVDRSVGREKLLDCWYASLLATDPKYQRRGYASSVVRAVCNRGIEEGKLVALGTQNEENAQWYRNLGFHEIAKIDVSSSLGNFPAYLLSHQPTIAQTHA